MIHDEPTTEIELTWLKSKPVKPATQVVKMRRDEKAKVAVHAKPKVESWVQEFDVKSPWVLRLLLVTAVLLLSMLVL